MFARKVLTTMTALAVLGVPVFAGTTTSAVANPTPANKQKFAPILLPKLPTIPGPVIVKPLPLPGPVIKKPLPQGPVIVKLPLPGPIIKKPLPQGPVIVKVPLPGPIMKKPGPVIVKPLPLPPGPVVVKYPYPYPMPGPYVSRPVFLAGPAVATTAVPAAEPASCLRKTELSDGNVLFQDVCTNQAAISGPTVTAPTATQ